MSEKEIGSLTTPIISFVINDETFLTMKKEEGKMDLQYDAENLTECAQRFLAYVEKMIEEGYEINETGDNFTLTFPKQGERDE